jgi:hypothetical protein
MSASDTELTEEETTEFFEERKGAHIYQIEQKDPDKWIQPCYPNDQIPINEQIAMTYNPGSEPKSDVITLSLVGDPQYTPYNPSDNRLEGLYCRKIENSNILECIKIYQWGFEMFRYIGSPKSENLCYNADYEADYDKSKTDDDQTRDISIFSSADCSCPGVPQSYKLNRSSARHIKQFTTESGAIFTDMEHLGCEWVGSHSSDRKEAAEIWLEWDVYHTATEDDAYRLYSDFSQDIVDHQPDCEKYDDCTAFISEARGDRTFFVVKSVFIRGDGATFPASHFADLSRVLWSEDGNTYVMVLSVSHPELDMGSSWVIDTAQSLETCAENLVNEK